MTALRTWAVAGVILLGACAGQGAEYRSPQGFSLAYPDGWIVLSKDQADEVRQEIQSRIKQLREVDLSQVAVIICEDNPAGFAANLNVVVSPGKAPIDKDDKELLQVFTDRYARLGVAVSDMQFQRMKVGGFDSLWVRYNERMPGLDQPLRQWQVMMSCGRRTYILTCTAPQADFAKYEPVFAAAVNSLRADPDSFWVGLLDDRVLTYALIGGTVGGLVALLKVLKQRKGRRIIGDASALLKRHQKPEAQEDH